MTDSEFDDIPTLLEEMKTVWGKINSRKPKAVKFDESDMGIIRRAFMAAANYEEMNKRWHEAHRLFVDKDLWPKDDRETTYVKNLKRAADITGIIDDDSKGKKFHPLKHREIYDHFVHLYISGHKGDDGCYYLEEGKVYKNEREFMKQIVSTIADEYAFPSNNAASQYLRTYFSLKNMPDFRDHTSYEE